jgi:predicted ATPase/predicted Ser/Thr protein kinase
MSNQSINNRYRPGKKLGEGGMGVVYSATDRLTGQTVALKSVIVPARQLQFATKVTDDTDARVSLAQEFRTLAGLRHPHIVSVLDYGFDEQRRPYFTMQLIENAQTITEYARLLPTVEKIRLLTEMLQALTYLHHRGIVHRDLKPANVMVNPEGVVRVMDFGLAMEQNLSGELSGVVGTMAYIAPEIFAEMPATSRSDLYAVGIIAYEMFMGQHPFPTKNAAAMVLAIISDVPDTSSLPFEIARVIDRLLAKNPDDRYESAQAVIDALCEAIGQPIPQESAALRESVIQAAKFVGREGELAALVTVLNGLFPHTLQPFDKNLWLIGGESGVGKSRLVDELRTRALVKGALVLRGQAVEGATLPYQLWRDPVRRLILSVDLNPLEASVLKEIVPDIATLLEHPVNDAPELSRDARQQRLVATLVAVIQRFFEGNKTPLILLLEDLHWAGESLPLLKRLIPLTRQFPFLIVGTYRDDEYGTLPAEFPEAQVMKLSRLSSDALANLTASMLGSAPDELVEMLARETEGNTFFIVEVVRALAEDVRRLSDIPSMSLPQQVITGGVREVVRRRLGRVPVWAQPTLKRAAVAGREIDLQILKRLIAHAASIESFLIACANAAVLEFTDGNWRFAHDKLREVMLHDLIEQERPLLHREIAEALEAVYPDQPAYAERLVTHWREAGDFDKEGYYTLIAGESLINRSEFERARKLLQHALTRFEGDSETAFNLLKLLGDVDENISSYAGAAAYYEQALALAEREQNEAQISEVLARRAKVVHRQGDLEGGENLVQRALEIAQRLDLSEVIATCYALLSGMAYTRGNFVPAYEYGLQAYHVRLELKNTNATADILNNLGVIKDASGDYELSLRYHDESLKLHQQIGNRSGVATNLNNMGTVALDMGNFSLARDYFHQSATIRREIGDRYGLGTTLANLGVTAYFQGDVAGACEYLVQGLEISKEIGDRFTTVLTLGNLVEGYTTLGEYELAREYLREALHLVSELNTVAYTAQILNQALPLMYLKSDPSYAAQVVGMISQAPEKVAETDGTLSQYKTQLETRLGVEAVATLIEKGQSLDFKSVIRRMLAEIA